MRVRPVWLTAEPDPTLGLADRSEFAEWRPAHSPRGALYRLGASQRNRPFGMTRWRLPNGRLLLVAPSAPVSSTHVWDR